MWNKVFILFILLALTGCGSIPAKAKQSYNQGFKAYKAGEYAQAISSFQAAIKSYPEYSDALFYLAESQRQSSLYKAAFKNYQKVLTLQPSRIEAHIGCGKVLLKKGEFHKALGYFKAVFNTGSEYDLQLSKENRYQAFFGLAQSYLGLGNPQTALNELEKAEKIRQTPAVYYYQGVAKEREGGQYEAAIEKYKKALDVDANYDKAHRALGYLYFTYFPDRKGSKKTALHHYKKYLEITNSKDEQIVAHLDKLEGKKKPKNGKNGDTNGKKDELKDNKKSEKKEKKLVCPLCGRVYTGKTKTCLFDSTPLKKKDE